MDKRSATWVWEQTHVKDSLVVITKMWVWAGHVKGRQDTRSSLRVTERIPREASMAECGRRLDGQTR